MKLDALLNYVVINLLSEMHFDVQIDVTISNVINIRVYNYFSWMMLLVKRMLGDLFTFL